MSTDPDYSLEFDSEPTQADLEQIAPTNYEAFVVDVVARSLRSKDSHKINQKVLRQCMSLASSFLVTDTAMNRDQGVNTWFVGLNQLIDLIIVLDKRNELELETINTASKVCSECWSTSGNWRELASCRDQIKGLAGKLRGLLDPNKKTYRGSPVYTA
ncbi:hypothetical protein CVT24_004039 [Panaeolus cyanescens]|uniref:Uncharacterized protein n=1 Tax=Panaeolus cyanescens TaxID=181874 RepID=A0A409Y6H9_9AGAR|nr:hypothetical protein CVT24_004039 [Panaeolus cyanescens]